MKKIDVLKLLKILCLIIFSCFFIAIFIGKVTIKHINYNEYISNADFFVTSLDSMYKIYPDLKDFFIDDSNIYDIDDLYNQTEIVLKIKIVSEPIIYGNAWINQAKVLDVLKQKNDSDIVAGDIVRIYDLVSSISASYVSYYGGTVPLNIGNEYIVFLKKAPSPNLNDTYIFSSIKYGSFNLSNSSNIMDDYISGDLTVKDIMFYERVNKKCEVEGEVCDYIGDEYDKLKKELLDKF